MRAQPLPPVMVMGGQCGVECEMCLEWFYIQCEGISLKEYKKTTETQETNLDVQEIKKKSFEDVSEKNRKLNDVNKKAKGENKEMKKRGHC